MSYKSVLFFIILIIFPLTFELTAQKPTNSDASIIYKTVSNFFDWYINAIKQKKYSEFQPSFVESKSGMTTLNFTEYFTILAKNGFSDPLIIKEKASYQRCIVNLENIRYIDFKTKFTDLDDFERMGCDFTNYYRWIGGQEPIDGIRIKSFQFNGSDSVTVLIDNYNIGEGVNYYWGNKVVTLIKIADNWKINSID